MSTSEEDMYASLKSRLRRPSAKALAATEEPQTLPPSPPTPSTVSGTPTAARKATLSLQLAVAETVMDEGIEAREEAVTIESLPAGEWKQFGFASSARKNKQNNSRRRSSNGSAVKKQVKLETDEVPVVEEEKTVQVSEEIAVETEQNIHEDEDDSHSEETMSVKDSAGAVTSPEVKRKRGRPFKGQEKPVEERLMIETCKIRRLIDDIMRKGNGESEFCLRLKNIAKDLDDVMALAHTFNPNASAQEEPSTAPSVDSGLPATLEMEPAVAPTAPVADPDPITPM